MAATTVTVRNALGTAIAAGSYVFAAITSEEVYLPEIDGKNLSTTIPTVQILSLAMGKTRHTRSIVGSDKVSDHEIATQILVTKKVSPSDNTDLDNMVEFLEQLGTECAKKDIGSNIEWFRNEPIATGEEEEYPYFIAVLGRDHIFHGSFVAFHKVVK